MRSRRSKETILMKYKVAVCDDSKTDREYVSCMVENWAKKEGHIIQICHFTSAENSTPIFRSTPPPTGKSMWRPSPPSPNRMPWNCRIICSPPGRHKSRTKHPLKRKNPLTSKKCTKTFPPVSKKPSMISWTILPIIKSKR